MSKAESDVVDWLTRARPLVHQQAPEIQPFNHLVKLPIALDESVCRESVENRLLHAHEIVLKEARTMARLAAEHGDDGTNDLLVSEIIHRNELQVWFVAEHVVDVPIVRV
jgi:starvation-inducible DNA-binding protein